MQVDDVEILRLFRIAETKEKAFNLLVRKYSETTYWHIRRIVLNHEDANDVLQNVYIKIWDNLHKFREESKLYTWIFRIAANEAISHINQSKAKYFVHIDEEHENFLAESLQSDNYFKPSEIEYKLQTGIARLPKKQKLVFLMRYYDALSYKDISEILGMNVSTLKATYHIAAKKIEEHLKNS